MKAIKIDDVTIVSLENVRKVNLLKGGLGTKTEPYHYFVKVLYTDNNTVSVNCKQGLFVDAQEVFDKIYEILIKD